jgi:hypothetical protein
VVFYFEVGFEIFQKIHNNQEGFEYFEFWQLKVFLNIQSSLLDSFYHEMQNMSILCLG